MKKNAKDRGRKNDVDTMRREYDFSTAVRGVTAPRYAQGTNVVVIDPDVLDVFPDGNTSSTSGSMKSEEHTSELQSHLNLVCRLLLEKKKHIAIQSTDHNTT